MLAGAGCPSYPPGVVPGCEVGLLDGRHVRREKPSASPREADACGSDFGSHLVHPLLFVDAQELRAVGVVQPLQVLLCLATNDQAPVCPPLLGSPVSLVDVVAGPLLQKLAHLCHVAFQVAEEVQRLPS